MDKIIFQNLRFFAHHGYFAHERRRGQHFDIDLELEGDLTLAGKTDQLAPDSCDYGQVYQLVKAIVCQRRFRLLEALAETICAEILQRFSAIRAVQICLRKPEAPLEGGILSAEQLASQGSSPDSETPEPAIPPWNCGQFAPGGFVGVQLRRSRRDTN